MTEEIRMNGMMDRRRFLKLLGAAGATGQWCPPVGPRLWPRRRRPRASHARPATGAGVPGSRALCARGDEAVFLYADGPGGNLGWKAGDAPEVRSGREDPRWSCGPTW